MTAKNKIIGFIRRQPRWRKILGTVLLLLLAVVWFRSGRNAGVEITFAARRGNLPINVLEGGSIEALESQEIRSEVKGGQGTKILKIVEEGYQVTEDDVKNGKVLVELDSADLKDRITQQEIQYQSTLATLADAVQGFEIQRNQNLSNIKAAEQKAQFAKMDVEKYLGEVASTDIIKLLKLDKLEAAATKSLSGGNIEQQMLAAMEKSEDDLSEELENGDLASAMTLTTNVNSNAAGNTTSAKNRSLAPAVDFTKYADPKKLGDGSAMQSLRKLQDDLQSAQQQQGLSDTKQGGTKRLYDKGFATKTELDTDTISQQNNQLRRQTAETALNLFIKYEFPRQAQELASKYEEALRSLEREKKEAISKLAQAKARLKNAESRYNIESNQRKEQMEQLDKCIIRAQKPGLVVYGGGGNNDFYGQEQIREGVSVRERQPIITIPDMTQMAVRVKIHETYIQKVQKGLPATIQIDAYPDKKLRGEVTKVALLPDSQNRWMNPDMKVYPTTVTISGAQAWIKPGMSAKVEIRVKELKDVIYVPLQAVTEMKGQQYCYVAGGVRTEQRPVTTGDYNDQFIEIKGGLKEGEKVLLRAPNDDDKGGKDKEKTGEKREGKPADGAPSADKPAGGGKPGKKKQN